MNSYENPQRYQPKTDRVIEGIPMTGTMLEYRERQLAALESFAGEQERTIARLTQALRNMLEDPYSRFRESYLELLRQLQA